MSSRWVPGAKAVIVITEHPVNKGRIVTLVETLGAGPLGTPIWSVYDGKLFRGYKNGNPTKTIDSKSFGIEQWKLRLLEDGEDTELRDDIEYVLEVMG